MRRYELTDDQWDTIADLFPSNDGKRGAPWNDHRRTLDGMLWILCSGAPWRDLPERYGPYQSVYDRFARYRRDGTLAAILARLHVTLDERGLIDVELWAVDSTAVRAHRAAAGARRDAVARVKEGGPARSPSRATTPSGVRAGASPRRSTTSATGGASRSRRA